MNVTIANGAIMLGGVNLGVVVGKVVFTRTPSNAEVSERDTIGDPVVPHIHGFGAFETNSLVSNACGGSVVCYKGSCKLGITEAC